MKSARPYRLFFPLVLLSACSAWKDKPLPPPPPPPPEARYQSAEQNELLRYGDELALMSAEARQAECARVLELAGPEAGAGTHLHLLQIQMLVDGCGDQRANLAALATLQVNIADESTRRWLAFQEQVAARWQARDDRCKMLEKQLQQTLKTVRTSRNRVKSRESEVQELKDKLDALKSIEENLGGSETGRNP